MPRLTLSLLLLRRALRVTAHPQEPACPPTQTDCGFYGCAELDRDILNCGACGTECLYRREYCEGGRCLCLNSGRPRCASECPDLERDMNNCGGCGNKCSAGQVCVASKCTPCAPGQTVCIDEFGDASCLNLQDDRASCGSCFNHCGEARCIAGECVCPSGKTLCQSGGFQRLCEDLSNSSRACGACNNLCFRWENGPVEGCVGGKCIRCPGGQLFCGGRCVNPQNDNLNCGMCGKTCRTGSNCVNRSCEDNAGCPAGQVRCSIDCINLQNDNRHCGVCDTECGTGKRCVGGNCV